MSKYIIGVDLGGTNMRAGVVSVTGKILFKKSLPTVSSADISDRIGDLIAEVILAQNIKNDEVVGVGIGVPGPIDHKNGSVLSPNLPQLSGLPIVEILERITGFSINLENDANAATYGEFWLGAGRDCRSLVMATLGTGIGGGIIFNGELVRGIDWTAGELGHVNVDSGAGARLCGCGARGCIETYASAISTERRFVEELERGRESELSSMDKNKITCVDIFEAYKDGDSLAVETINETGRMLGILCSSMANLLNPEKFIFSGGITNEWDILSKLIIDEFNKRVLTIPGQRMQILRAELENDAGLIGAAGCALKTYETSQ